MHRTGRVKQPNKVCIGLKLKLWTYLRVILTNRLQKTKVNISFSIWIKLLLGVPTFINMHFNESFYMTETTNACNYVEDTIFHACDLNLISLLIRLEQDVTLL